MDSSVLSLELKATYIRWKPWSKYAKQTLVSRGNNTFMRDGTYYWRSPDGGQYTKIPQFLFLTIQGQYTQTAVFGPYIFYNNFELTREAQYIKRMLAYPTLTARAKQKVDKILVGYHHWVTVDDEFMSILERRNSNDRKRNENGNGQRNTKQRKER